MQYKKNDIKWWYMRLEITFKENKNGVKEWIDQNGNPLKHGYAKNNEICVKTETDLIQTKARFLHYTGKVFRDEHGNLLEGDVYRDETILRFHNGLLDGQELPAVEGIDCHIERWKEGFLQRVTTDYMDRREIWKNNVPIEIIIDKD